MNRLALGIGAALLATAFALPARADELPWEKSFDDAVKKAGASNRLLMVDFYTDW